MNQPAECSLADFAGIAGFKRSYVTQLKKDGRLVLTSDGKRVRVPESLALLAATRDPSKAGVVARHAANRATTGGEGAGDAAAGGYAATQAPPAASDPSGQAASTYQASRAVRERYLAMEAKRAYEAAIGKLMPAAAVEAAVASAVVTFRSSLETLPDVLGPQLAAITDEGQARATIAAAIEHALEEIARQFTNIAKQDAP